MKILITGGAGFIGSNFIYYLQESYPQYTLICLDALTYAGNQDTLSQAALNPRFKFIKADIADRNTVYKLFAQEKIDRVVNFAAESHVDRSINEPEIFFKTNVLGTQVLLDACRIFNVSRFHQVSTDEVYGDLPLDRPDLLFHENSPIRPSSPYSASKAAADLIVQAYHRTYGLPVTISRCSNNFGPYHFPEKLIPLAIIKAVSGQKIPVYGSGKNIRDWLYVKDHCKAIDLILQKGAPGEVYNLGGGNERTNLEVIQLILDKLGQPFSLIDFVADRPGHDLRYAIDFGKAKSELGWVPAVEFEKGLEETIAWYLANHNWWQKLLPEQFSLSPINQ